MISSQIKQLGATWDHDQRRNQKRSMKVLFPNVMCPLWKLCFCIKIFFKCIYWWGWMNVKHGSMAIHCAEICYHIKLSPSSSRYLIWVHSTNINSLLNILNLYWLAKVWAKHLRDFRPCTSHLLTLNKNIALGNVFSSCKNMWNKAWRKSNYCQEGGGEDIKWNWFLKTKETCCVLLLMPIWVLSPQHCAWINSSPSEALCCLETQLHNKEKCWNLHVFSPPRIWSSCTMTVTSKMGLA